MDQASPQRPATAKPLDETLLHRMDRWWRAANYLSVGQIYLLANPLLREKLAHAHVKRRLLGHFGTTPGLNFIWVHLNRLIRARDLNVIFIAGPGHGAPGLLASTWLEGSYTELYPSVTQDSDRHPASVSPVLLPRRRPEPCRAGNPRLDPRGRRARLFPVARIRRGVRQSGPAGCLRDRRRRGGDRAAGNVMARQQVPQSGNRRRGAADPAPQWLQDRQSDHPGAHRTGRAARFPRRQRLGTDLCRGP